MIKKAEKEFIFGTDTVTASCHASTVLPLGDGTVLAAWFGGKKEGDDSVGIFLSVRGQNGNWSSPKLISEDVPVPHWNPVLFERSDGEIVLFYKYGHEISDWITKYVILSRGGDVISTPAELVPGDTSGGRGPVKNKCLRLSDGRLLAPDRLIGYMDEIMMHCEDGEYAALKEVEEKLKTVQKDFSNMRKSLMEDIRANSVNMSTGYLYLKSCRRGV